MYFFFGINVTSCTRWESQHLLYAGLFFFSSQICRPNFSTQFFYTIFQKKNIHPNYLPNCSTQFLHQTCPPNLSTHFFHQDLHKIFPQAFFQPIFPPTLSHFFHIFSTTFPHFLLFFHPLKKITFFKNISSTFFHTLSTLFPQFSYRFPPFFLPFFLYAVHCIL